MLGGAYGKFLHINLTTGETYIEQPDDEFYRLLVGGRSVIAYFLLRELPVNVEPLSPENILIFAPGILQGNNLPGSGRHSVGGKSPLTGAIGSSESGGWWGHEFKRTGFDGLIFHGRSEKPVYFWVHTESMKFDLRSPMGATYAQVESMIRDELGDDHIRWLR
jgi:aldehyde:ferredoxin oxidoreductase